MPKPIIIRCVDCYKPATTRMQVQDFVIPLCWSCSTKRGKKPPAEDVKTIILKENTGEIEPNIYDMETVCNGCGNSLVKKIGIEANLIFYPACLRHDFRYSRFSKCSREKADDLFRKEMQELIDKGDYSFAEDLLYEIMQELYYQLVDKFGAGSYEEYNPGLPLPSTRVAICDKIDAKKIRCVQLKTKVKINNLEVYIWRWWTRSEAEVLGLI